MKRTLITTVFLFFGGTTICNARQPEWNCERSEASSVPEMNYCACEHYASAEKKLNETYKQLSSTLSSSEKAGIQRNQRHWLKAIAQQCKNEVGPQLQGGSAWTSEHCSCLESKATERTKYLRRQMAEPNSQPDQSINPVASKQGLTIPSPRSTADTPQR